MVRNPVVFGIYSYYNTSLKKTISYRIPYINSFDIQKDSDNITVRATVTLPKNILYTIDKGRNPSDITVDEFLSGGKSNSPYFFEYEQRLGKDGVQEYAVPIPNGLQVLNQYVDNKGKVIKNTAGYDTQYFEWVSLDKLPGTKLGADNKASQDLIVQNLNDANGNYLGKAFTFDTSFDYNKATTFTIDSQLPDIQLANMQKVSKSAADQDIVSIFSVGDLFTLRHGLLESVSKDGDKLKTDSFYITKVVPTENEIELHLENWTWKLRQIPARGSLNTTQTLYDFLNTYIFPVILKETYINAIVSRDAENPSGALPPSALNFSKLTSQLKSNNLNNGFYLPITNFYDILSTLKEQFLINFVNVDYLGSACVTCSIGYSYRDVGSTYEYVTNRDVISKDMTKISYDDYKLLVRLTSNRTLSVAETKALRASVGTQSSPEQWTEIKSQKAMIGRVVYGDRGVLGFVTSNSSRLGQQTLTTSGNADSVSIVNYTKLYYEKENLYELAIKIWRKLKFATSINSIKTLPFLYGSPGLYDIITLVDTRNSSINGCYIVSSINYSMSVNGGYSQNISFGVRIPFDQLTNFVENI